LTKDIANTQTNESIKIITGQENITNFMLQCYQRAKTKLDTCLDFIGPSVVSTDNRIMKGAMEMIERGIKIRFITDITKENIDYCKNLVKVSEVRHIKGVKGNFGIMDEQEYVIHLIHQESQAPSQIIYSDDRGSAEAQQFLFNVLWKAAIPLEDRRLEIENGEHVNFIETLRDPSETINICHEIVSSTTKEILLLIPTVNGFYLLEREGIMALLQKMAQREVRIRVLTPPDNRIMEIAKSIIKKFNQFEWRYVKEHLHQTTASIIIISDNKFSLMIGLKDYNKYKSILELIGLSVYSYNESNIWSHTTICENLWLHSEILV
jgi:two-component system sensor histidine kinase VicK